MVVRGRHAGKTPNWTKLNLDNSRGAGCHRGVTHAFHLVMLIFTHNMRKLRWQHRQMVDIWVANHFHFNFPDAQTTER